MITLLTTYHDHHFLDLIGGEMSAGPLFFLHKFPPPHPTKEEEEEEEIRK